MKIKYSEKIDKKIFDEVNKECPRLSKIMGFEFKPINFDRRIIPIAKATEKVAMYFVDEKRIKEMMERMYNKKIPQIKIYINTTPYSTWNVKNKWISVSIERIGEKFFQTVCHEASHFMYDYCFGTEKYQDTEVKETLTILNNIFGIIDKGWNKFFKQREKILEFYNKTKDFEETINYARNLFKK
jgi:hypothetical protein